MAFRVKIRWVGGEISSIGGYCERDRCFTIVALVAFCSEHSEQVHCKLSSWY